MSLTDLIFFAGASVALTVMLVSSKFIRAIVWETFRHPFTRSHIESHDGKIKVWREESKSQKESPRG